jgi:hypothetical protein
VNVNGVLSQDIHSALSRWSWVPASVGAVIIHKIILPDPVELVDFMNAQSLMSRLLPPVVALCCLDARGGVAVHNKAGVHVELLICGNERSVGPVELHPPVVGGCRSPLVASQGSLYPGSACCS